MPSARVNRRLAKDDEMIQDPEWVLDRSAVIVLDQLALEGGPLPREDLLARCQPFMWGRWVNVAARRAGYGGQDEHEIEARGKRQLFDEGLKQLVSRQLVVIWDEHHTVLALHPMHREPLVRGGKPYIPGSIHARDQRDGILREVRGRLLAFLRDATFSSEFDRLIALLKLQIRRGHLASESLDAVLLDLASLADAIVGASSIGKRLDISEAEVQQAIQRARKSRLSVEMPKSIVEPPEQVVEAPEQIVEASRGPVEDVHPPVEMSSQLVERTGESDGVWLRLERCARNLTTTELATAIGMHRSSINHWEAGKGPLSDYAKARLNAYFAEHPVTVVG
jgi:DNA-binding transcriptional regulator YiaG